MIKRLHFGRRWLVASVLVVAVVAAGGAYAGHQDSNVLSYTGCLNTGGDTSGVILHVKIGNNPAKPCGSNQVQIHLSGGDITAVRTPTGSGLTGGSENGAVTLGLTAQQLLPSCSAGRVPGWNGAMWVCYSAGTGLAADTAGNNWNLATSYRLPQSCSDGQVAKDSGMTWVCGNDNDTTYSAGTGLDLSGTEFSIEPGYRLPQSCGSDQVAKSDGSGSWSCANDLNSGFPPAFEAEEEGAIDISPAVTVLTRVVPTSGIYLIVGKVVLSNGDDDPQNATCTLRVDNNVIDTSAVRNPPDEPSGFAVTPEGTVALVEVITLGAGNSVTVHCGGFMHHATNRQLAIVRVGSLN